MEQIAYCGLNCSECLAFLATKNDDDNERAKTAKYYNKNYGFNLKPEEVNCDGCKTSGGCKLGYCSSCEIRECAEEKSLENCAYCKEQPCEKLVAFHKFSPGAKVYFDELLKEIGK